MSIDKKEIRRDAHSLTRADAAVLAAHCLDLLSEVDRLEKKIAQVPAIVGLAIAEWEQK